MVNYWLVLFNYCSGKTIIENNSKAVRDLIPEILKLSGRECMTSKLSDSDFLPELEKKLYEELKEYLDSNLRSLQTFLR
jgi:predicted house-cleaning noncanonical NTP pyrophosphatase (MazG superfamily)